MEHPCSAEPDLWFGYADDDGGDNTAKAKAYQSASAHARMICLRKCPLAQQRLCAGRAVEAAEEYGVWAGVKLPGNQYRKRKELARAHDVLRRIALGEINPRQLPENMALLSGQESSEALSIRVIPLQLADHRPPSAA